MSDLQRRISGLQLGRIELTRRNLLGLAAAGAMGSLLAACGGDDDDDDSAATTEAEETESSEGEATGSAEATEPAEETSEESTAEESGSEETSEEETATEASTEEAASGSTEEPADEDIPDIDELTVGTRGDIDILLPDNLSGVNNYAVTGNIYQNIVRYITGTAELVPELAQSWEISDDGLIYNFSLAEGVQFHKGYGEFTSADVKGQFDRIMDPELDSFWQSRYDSLIESIEADDDYTVIFNMHEAYTPFLALIAGDRGGPISSAKAVEERGREVFNLDPIGTGPYYFESWAPGTETILTRFDEFWGKKSHVKQLRLVPIPDQTVASTALQTGEIVAYHPFRDPVVIAELEQNPDVVIERATASGIWGLYYKLYEPPYDSLQVRQAINHAINKQELIEQVLPGAAIAAVSFLSPALDAHTDDLTVYEYDPEKAKALLAEAGYEDGFEVNFLTTQLAPWPLVAPVIAANLEAIGLKVNTRQLEHATYREENRKLNFDITVQGNVDVPDPDSWAYVIWHSDSIPVNNPSGYDKADDLISQARFEQDPDTRIELYIEIQRMLADDAAFVPLFHLTDSLGRRANIQGLRPGIINDFILSNMYVEDE